MLEEEEYSTYFELLFMCQEMSRNLGLSGYFFFFLSTPVVISEGKGKDGSWDGSGMREI